MLHIIDNSIEEVVENKTTTEKEEETKEKNKDRDCEQDPIDALPARTTNSNDEKDSLDSFEESSGDSDSDSNSDDTDFIFEEQSLGLGVDKAILSSSLKQGLSVFLDPAGKMGQLIFSLKDLEMNKVYFTANGNRLLRIADNYVILGDSENVSVPEEDDVSTVNGILTLEGDSAVYIPHSSTPSAEQTIQRLTGQQLYLGIPLREEKTGKGHVVFSLRQLPDNQKFVFHKEGKQVACLEKLDAKTFLINGQKHLSAPHRIQLGSDKSILELAFPSLGQLSAEYRLAMEEEEDLLDFPELDLGVSDEKEMEIAYEEKIMEKYNKCLSASIERREREKKKKVLEYLSKYTESECEDFLTSEGWESYKWDGDSDFGEYLAKYMGNENDYSWKSSEEEKEQSDLRDRHTSEHEDFLQSQKSEKPSRPQSNQWEKEQSDLSEKWESDAEAISEQTKTSEGSKSDTDQSREEVNNEQLKGLKGSEKEDTESGLEKSSAGDVS
eukprot:CAMPEP_0174259336 /NCGR_PEP_ID=MMETSP0439-20130205/8171_1 /TAXON_ID=0 /ORGANISM="Stereomyxa ramosa, Strain Chinc5" /LENGTH=495 /DNA_ID=CAMNT_0015343173 /DNA_START=144 /DNA_END=1631 /DNA_ORIENTATION=+